MTDLIEVRDQGLYCPAGDFFVDPWRGVERAVITHGHADHARSGSRHYWAAKPGERLLRERIGYGGGLTALDYGRPARIGAATVSLHPAGHVLGSAQVRIEAQGQVWVVSGDYKRDSDPTCAPFEPVRCDVFVTEATFALPVYRWPAPEAVAREILDWWRECQREGQTAMLCCYAFGKAQRILAELARLTGETAYLHGAMTRLVKLYREAGVAMLPTQAVGDQVRHFDWRGRLVLAPPGASGTPWMKRFRPESLGFASGWMRVRGARRQPAYDRGFVLSDHADWPSLLRTVEDTGARRVLATHGNTDALIGWLRGRGIEAAALSPRFGGQPGATAKPLDAVEEAAAGVAP